MKHLIVKHKHQMVLGITMALSCAFGVVISAVLGLGGIQTRCLCLVAGVILVELGRSITCFGQAEGNRRREYIGVAIQGLGVWVTFLNPEYLSQFRGWELLAHLISPSLMLIALPVAVHHAVKHGLYWMGWLHDPEDEEPAASALPRHLKVRADRRAAQIKDRKARRKSKKAKRKASNRRRGYS